MENLNDYVLLEIFKYCKSDSLSLVCKRFYDLVCKSKRYRIIINPDMLDDEGIYESVLNSHRCFENLEIVYCEWLKPIIQQDFYSKIKTISILKGSNIKKLSLCDLKIDAEWFFEFLNYFPNIETLDFMSINLYDCTKRTGTLNLLHLKDLKINFCNENTSTFFCKHLPHNVLKTLYVDRHVPDLLINQQSIMNLSLQCELSAEWTPISSLTKLTLVSCEGNERVFCSVLKQQPNIEELDILKGYKAINGDKETFDSLCNLKNLKVLAMDFCDLLHVDMTNFQKLKNLEELELVDREYLATSRVSDIIMEMSYIRFENLRKLKILSLNTEITMDHIRRMGATFPHVNCLQFVSRFPIPIEVFLDSFKSINYLKVGYWCKMEFSTFCSTLRDKVYPNLKSLEFGNLKLNNDSLYPVEKLKKSLPNLKICKLACVSKIIPLRHR